MRALGRLAALSLVLVALVGLGVRTVAAEALPAGGCHELGLAAPALDADGHAHHGHGAGIEETVGHLGGGHAGPMPPCCTLGCVVLLPVADVQAGRPAHAPAPLPPAAAGERPRLVSGGLERPPRAFQL